MLSGCGSSQRSTEGLTVTSSTEYLELCEALARQFGQVFGEEILVKGTLGQEQVLLDNGLTDIIISSTSIEHFDQKYATQLIGYETLLVVVNSENPLDVISRSSIKKIFAGDIVHWGDIGIEFNKSIKLLTRESNSGMRQAFQKNIIVDNQKLSLRALTVNSNTEMKLAVKRISSGIGYISGKPQGVADGIKALQVLDEEEKPIVAPNINIYVIYKVKDQKKKLLVEFLEYLYTHQAALKILKDRGIVLATPPNFE